MFKVLQNRFLQKTVGALCAGVLLHLAFDAPLLAPLSVVSLMLLALLLDKSPQAFCRCLILSFFVFVFVFLQFAFLWTLARAEGWEDLLINVVIAVVYLIPLYAVSFIRSKYYVEITLIGWLISEYLFSNISVGNQLFQLGIIPANFPAAIQWYEFTGIHWGSLWLILISYSLYRAFFSKKFIFISATVIIIPLLVSICLHPRTTAGGASRQVAIIPLAVNDDADSMIRELEAFNLKDVDYVLFPEGTLKLHEKAVEVSPVMTALKRLAQRNKDVSIFLGIFSYSTEAWDNSMLVFSSNKTSQRFKALKVPFCEYLPCPSLLMRFDFIKNNVKYPLPDRVNPSELIIHTQDTIAPLICYEGLSTNFVSSLARQGANVFFVSSSNTFINSDHIEHINRNIIQANAIITRKQFVRCVEHGHSSIIQTDGRVDLESVLQTRIIVQPVELNSVQTFYVKNGSIMNMIYIILLFASLIALGFLDSKTRLSII